MMNISSANSKYRILAGFAAVIVLMVMVAAMGIMRMAENNRGMKTIVDEHNVKTRLLIKMHSTGRERSILLFRMLITDDPFDRDNDYMKYIAGASDFVRARDKFSSMPLDNQERALLQEQGALVGKVQPLQDEAMRLILDGDISHARDILINKAIPQQDALMEKLAQMLEQQQQSARNAMFASNQSFERTVVAIGVLSFFAVIIAVMVAFFVVRKTAEAETVLFSQFDEERKLRMQLTYQASAL